VEQLDRLKMEEVSGVNDPANQLPGWMVAKSVGSATGSHPRSSGDRIWLLC
jgi:hypothetical protein